jgi:hypothetical protein
VKAPGAAGSSLKITIRFGQFPKMAAIFHLQARPSDFASAVDILELACVLYAVARRPTHSLNFGAFIESASHAG